jgi:DNA-binding transcriptional LysR family regulator
MPLTDLEELRTLVAVIDAGSLSAAARRLNVTVNAVSRRIMRLESGLGAKLLNRSTRALSLTDEGRRLQVRARRVLDELCAAEDDIARGR